MADHFGSGTTSGQQYALYKRALIDAFLKLDPRSLYRNIVMFTVEIGSVITTLLWVQALGGQGEESAGFIGAIAAWLWFTVLFANFAEALAEGRGKAQAESLRKMRQDTEAKKLYLGYEIEKGKETIPDRFHGSFFVNLAQVGPLLRRGRGYYPGRWRSCRGYRFSERECDHR